MSVLVNPVRMELPAQMSLTPSAVSALPGPQVHNSFLPSEFHWLNLGDKGHTQLHFEIDNHVQVWD